MPARQKENNEVTSVGDMRDEMGYPYWWWLDRLMDKIEIYNVYNWDTKNNCTCTLDI